MPTMWEFLCEKYKQEPTTWEQDFQYRKATGGTDRAATMYANGLHPKEQRELPDEN